MSPLKQLLSGHQMLRGINELLTDQTAVVTGSASGLGRAIARKFAEQGADVVVADTRRTPREGGGPTDDLVARDENVDVAYVECDVTNKDDLSRAVDRAGEFGGLDITVNNAGLLGPTDELRETDESKYRQLVDVNLNGTYYGCQVAAADMCAREVDGSIINMSSIAGIRG